MSTITYLPVRRDSTETPKHYRLSFAGLIVINFLIVASCIFGAWTFFADTVFAAATPSATAVKIAAKTFKLDASASPCVNGGCDFSWRVYGPGYNRLGGTAGDGPIVTFTTPNAGYYTFVVTETEYCTPGGGKTRKSCPGTTQVDVTATA